MFFSSIRLTITLLTTLVITSILGTIIPQNGLDATYLRLFGRIFYRLFDFIGIFDIYHSYLFQTILFMLSINIIVCTYKQLPGVWKIVFYKRTTKQLKFTKFSQNLRFISYQKFEKVCKFCHIAISREFRHPLLEKIDENIVIYAETGRWTKLGVHVVHLSILLLLFGGLLSSIFGFEGYVNIPEGDTVHLVRLKGSNKVKNIDFGIRCDNFDIKFYKNGLPKEYKSEITLVKDNVPIADKHITVNDPMHYNGVNIFQSSYGKMPPISSNKSILPDNLEINLKSKYSGNNYTEKLNIGVEVTLPEKLGKFSVLDYFPSVSFNGVNIGAVFKCIYKSIDSELSEDVILPLDFPAFDSMRGGDVIFSLSDELVKKINLNRNEQPIYYTGLQVSNDPGKEVVYVSFILMILGFIVTLLMSHRRLYIKLTQNEQITEIILTGYSNRNKLAMKVMLDKIYMYVSSNNSSLQ